MSCILTEKHDKIRISKRKDVLHMLKLIKTKQGPNGTFQTYRGHNCTLKIGVDHLCPDDKMIIVKHDNPICAPDITLTSNNEMVLDFSKKIIGVEDIPTVQEALGDIREFYEDYKETFL